MTTNLRYDEHIFPDFSCPFVLRYIGFHCTIKIDVLLFQTCIEHRGLLKWSVTLLRTDISSLRFGQINEYIQCVGTDFVAFKSFNEDRLCGLFLKSAKEFEP